MTHDSTHKPYRFWDHPWSMTLTVPVLLALSFPPFNAPILQIPAFVFLIRLAMLCETRQQVIYYAWPSFVLWNLFSTYWVMMASVTGGMAAILANATLMLIPLLMIRHLFQTELNPILISLLAASVWVSYEFLHHNWTLSWPWLTLGNGWANLTGLIQYISVTGVLGISFWVMFTAALLYAYICKQEKRILVAAMVIFFAFPGFSLLSSLAGTDRHQGEPVEVAIVQPNTDSYLRFGGLLSLDALLDKLLATTGEALTKNTDVIIWPENAIDSTLTIDSPYFMRVRDSLDVWNVPLITGSGLVEIYDNENHPRITRTTHDGQQYNIYNAALFLQPGERTEVYRKRKLVPGVERFPFSTFLARIDRFGWVDWGAHAGYGRGKTADLFDINGTLTPALICYDSVFPGWVNRFVNQGAGFLIIITNDGWWGDSHGHRQHFAYARLRAIEHRMWIARSANNGISGIISPDGTIRKKTDYGTEDAFIATIYASGKRTLYSKHGEWFGLFILFSSIVGWMSVRNQK